MDINKMHIATHLITIKGVFDKTWSEESLRELVEYKIKNKIFSTFHASLEGFWVNKNNIDVSVYISCLPSEVDKGIVQKWIKDNITEDDLKVTWFKIDEINCLYNRKDFSVMIE